MAELWQVDQEFLQRALGWGEEGNPDNVEVLLGSVPADFPVDLADVAGMRVLGGVRSGAEGWTFFQGGSLRTPIHRQHWRVFLDLAGPAPDVFSRLLDHFTAQGWQPAAFFAQVFVEAKQTTWTGVHGKRDQDLQLQLRSSGAVTQVWLTVSELEAGHAGHLRGEPQPYPAGFEHLRHYEAPMPTLRLPPGWKAQMGQGSGGPVRSLDYSLQAPQAGETLVQDLFAHLAPQFEKQGWRQLYQDGWLTVYRTAQGLGVLILKPEPYGLSAQIVHVTSEEGSGPSYTLVSQA